jgi:hypothetical protein
MRGIALIRPKNRKSDFDCVNERKTPKNDEDLSENKFEHTKLKE